jgi:hypothetical protein
MPGGDAVKFTVKHMRRNDGQGFWCVVRGKKCAWFFFREGADYAAERCRKDPSRFEGMAPIPISDFTEIKPPKEPMKGRNESKIRRSGAVHKTRHTSKSAGKNVQSLSNRPSGRSAKGNQSLSTASRKELEAFASQAVCAAERLLKKIEAL